ncbi:response regulator receiver domain [Burkholderia sp. 22PA0106]|uniref:response regulator receiver domain n=1 Tax=Burkholderia sp. 22PA0106 TaxID=3237371 RepID=UPI0039C0FD73
MSEALEQEYGNLVREVYIAPIRSVIVVDDDFPTLDGLLAAQSLETTNSAKAQAVEAMNPAETQAPGSVKSAAGESGTVPQASRHVDAGKAEREKVKKELRQEEVERVRQLVELCRNRPRPWLVDVHDGKEVNAEDELKIAPYLHHSDLMILDYHLLGVDQGGDRAIGIMRKLAENDHFNLVIVYTRGYEGNIQTVFDEIVTGLVHRQRQGIDDALKEALQPLINEWEDETGEDVSATLSHLVDRKEYLEELRTPGWIMMNTALRGRIVDLIRTCPPDIKKQVKEIGEGSNVRQVRIEPKTLVAWALASRHSVMAAGMSPVSLGQVAFDFADDVNWIRTKSLFVTVVNKHQEPAKLVDVLERALNAWCPVPHQLLMSKMRAQMDERGVIAEGEVLTDKFVQTGWLMETVDGHGDRDRAVRHSVDRHWEALGDKMRADIEPFAHRLFHNLQQRGKEDVFKRFGVKDVKPDSSEVFTHLNYFYSTKPVDRSHLTTGHVLELQSPERDTGPQYWVCLSPACDLVPGQKTGGWRARLGNYLPFIAVSLMKVSAETALGRINENAFLFIRTSGGIEAFTFYPNAEPTNVPSWEQMFAADAGRFIEGDTTIKIGRTRDDQDNLQIVNHIAKVVCQLRYEYALNLLQRLGGSMSRIGLDFRKQAQVGSAVQIVPAAVNTAGEAVANSPVMTVATGDNAAA